MNTVVCADILYPYWLLGLPHGKKVCCLTHNSCVVTCHCGWLQWEGLAYVKRTARVLYLSMLPWWMCPAEHMMF